MSLKILMCCHLPLDPKLGGAKVYIENAKAYEREGHSVLLLGIDDIAPNIATLPLQEKIKTFPALLRQYLEENASQFDVVEYEYLYYPFPKPLNAKKTKFVARSVLLEFHLRNICILEKKDNFIKEALSKYKQKYLLEERLSFATKTCKFADYINVPNKLDKEELIRLGFEENKIIVSPYGTFLENKVLNSNSNKYELSFLASFDPRKGCYDLVDIFTHLYERNSSYKLNILGAKGRFKEKDHVISFFPKRVQENVNVVMSFEPDSLSDLLKTSSIGIFPSYLESFGFGALEMTQRGIPTVGYRVPGPSDILPKSLLVEREDKESMVDLIEKLSQNEEFYNISQEECFKISRDLKWSKSVQPALEAYLKG